jgi:hypothetical protein
MMTSQRFAAFVSFSVIMIVSVALIGLGTTGNAEAEQKQPSPFRQTTKDLCERRYTACVGNCYINYGSSNASSKSCTNLCYKRRTSCVNRI